MNKNSMTQHQTKIVWHNIKVWVIRGPTWVHTYRAPWTIQTSTLGMYLPGPLNPNTTYPGYIPTGPLNSRCPRTLGIHLLGPMKLIPDTQKLSLMPGYETNPHTQKLSLMHGHGHGGAVGTGAATGMLQWGRGLQLAQGLGRGLMARLNTMLFSNLPPCLGTGFPPSIYIYINTYIYIYLSI